MIKNSKEIGPNHYRETFGRYFEDFQVGDIVKINHKKVDPSNQYRIDKIMSKNIKVVKTNVPEGRIAGEIRVSPGLLEVA